MQNLQNHTQAEKNIFCIILVHRAVFSNSPILLKNVFTCKIKFKQIKRIIRKISKYLPKLSITEVSCTTYHGQARAVFGVADISVGTLVVFANIYLIYYTKIYIIIILWRRISGYLGPVSTGSRGTVPCIVAKQLGQYAELLS